MARTKTTEGQAVGQPGGAKEDSRFREGNKELRLEHEEEEEQQQQEQELDHPFNHLSSQSVSDRDRSGDRSGGQMVSCLP